MVCTKSRIDTTDKQMPAFSLDGLQLILSLS